MILWLQFLACAAIITFAGSRLSKYGDLIAEITGLSRGWIGVVLLASVTSLPELITGTTAVALHDLPDIAAGDVLGSCMFNIAIIALLDFLCRERPILSNVSRSHVLNGCFGMSLLAVVNISLLVGDRVPAIGWVGLYTPILLIGYLISVRLLFQFERNNPEKSDEPKGNQNISRARAFSLFGINAAIVVAAATWLPQLGEKISEQTGLEQSFVGTLFIAVSTSLPEFVVTFSALRAGAVNLALGNLFGSNLFNMAVLAIEDIAYTKGPLLAAVSSSHAISSNMALLMAAIAISAIIYGSKAKRFGFGWASVALVIVFVIGTIISYLLGASSN